MTHSSTPGTLGAPTQGGRPDAVWPNLLAVLLILVSAASPAAAQRAADPLKARLLAVLESQPVQIDGAWKRLQPAVLAAASALDGATAAEAPTLLNAFHGTHRTYESLGRVVLAQVDPRLDVQAGDDFFDGFFLPEDNRPELLETVQQAVDHLGAASSRRDLRYRAGVFTGDKLDAFTKEGERIVVSEAVARSGADERLAILAHEMAHLETRDLVRVRLVRELNRRFLERVDPGIRKAVEKVLTWCERRYQRFQEFEADARAVELLGRTGCRAGGLVTVLGELGAGEPPASMRPGASFITDHPSASERLAALRRNHPELFPAGSDAHHVPLLGAQPSN